MSLDDTIFWIGLTVFGTGLYLVAELHAWGLALIMIGAAGIIYSVRGHLRRPSVGRLSVLLMIVTWAIVGYDIYARNVGSPFKPQLTQPVHSPASSRVGGFSEQFRRSLQWNLLRLPRPCPFKILAPPESTIYRKQLEDVILDAQIEDINFHHFVKIEQCQILDEDLDRNPQLFQSSYGHQTQFPGHGMTIEASDPQTRDFLAGIFQSQSIQVNDAGLDQGSFAKYPPILIVIVFGHHVQD